MKTVLEPLDTALAALNAEIRRLTVARDDLAGLIDEMRGAEAVAPVRSLPATATRKAARTEAAAKRPNQHTTRRARSPKPCPIDGCDKVCADGTGLSAHIRSAHPEHAPSSGPPRAGSATPLTRPTVADVAELERAIAP